MNPAEWKSIVSRALGPALVRQHQLKEIVGESSWQIDLPMGVIKFDSGEYPLQVLGSWANDKTLLWAWANPLPEHVIGLSRHVREVGESCDLGFFKNAQVQVDHEQKGYFLFLVANACVSDKPLYWAPNGENRVAINVDVKLPDSPDLMLQVPQMLTDSMMAPFELDHREFATNFFEFLGYEVESEGSLMECRSGPGTFRITFDQLDRIADVNMSIEQSEPEPEPEH